MTRHFQRLACASFLLSSAFLTFADRVSTDEARAIATEFIGMRTGMSPSQIRLTDATSTTPGTQPGYYVFNIGTNGGFVIISGETSTTPVLGYSFEGAYNAKSLPDAMKWMMSGLEREIKAAPAEQSSLTTSEIKNLTRKAAKANEASKLLSTPSWSQEAPFNNLIPGKPLVGCVGTAMATVMKYHQYPAKGTGSFDGVDFGANYNWTDMRTDNYRSGYTQQEADAVATLMYHASKSINTQYAMSGSSAYEVRVPAALSKYFGYDPGVSYKKRSEVADQASWDRIVKDEIDAGRPVIYCGQDVTAGHAFVCDGYQGEYLHFNWGWGGSANGYFLSTALNPTVSREHHYNNLNTIIYNIKPLEGVIAEWSPIHITADGNQPGIGSDLTDLSNGKSFTVRVGNLKNLSYDDFSGKIAVALFGADGKMKTLLSAPASFSLQSMATLYNGYTDMRNCQLPSGTSTDSSDRIMVVTQDNGQTEWLPVAGELYTINELPASRTAPESFAVTLPAGVAGVNISGENSVIRGWNYTFSVVPENDAENVVTVKANGYVLTPGNDYKYTIANVREDQNVTVLVQKASEVKAKRSIWVESPGTLADLIPETESGTIKDLSLFGTIDARDFAFMRNNMKLQRVDLSGVYISAHGTDQANAIPREAFRGVGSLEQVILPKNITRLNNGCFRQTGLTSITIPASVKTYEYNIFVAASRLQHIYVGRESAEFINWCVLSGVKVATATLHVPNERAVANYSKAENWNTIGNIVVDPIQEADDVAFAVMEDADVKYDSETAAGRLPKGSEVKFTSTYIPDNDNRMEVYANSTLLTPDAEGVYTTTLTGNTIIHFNLLKPTEVDPNKSAWTLTDKLGSVGLLTDAVNVIPGQEFQVRVNTLNIPQYFDQLFWAMALTDEAGNIKEFISPVNLWTAGVGDSFKMNVNCCVKESKVRQGNMIRLVTSANKRNWNVVKAVGEDMTDALAALNNQTPVYNITVPDVEDATISGLPESGTAVRGRDLTLKVTPKSAAYRVDLFANGVKVLSNQTAVNYTFVVKEDMNFDIDVYDPKAEGVLEMTVAPGTFHVQLTEQNVAATVILHGEVYSSDLQHATGKDFSINTIKTLDLRDVTIKAQDGYAENEVSHPFFVYTNGMESPASVVENILLPDNVVRILGGVFKNCANIKEITLPSNLRSVPIKPDPNKNVYQYGLAADAFKGCTKLTTIRIPGEPGEYNGRRIVAHHNPYSTTNSFWYTYYNLGHEDPKKVTVIVPDEYLSIYTTAYKEGTFGNPWKDHGYNILSEYPVYGVNFDPTRVKAEEGVDVSSIASFLGDNVSLSSLAVEGKLKLLNPEVSCFVFDNGKMIQPTEDGYINLEFLNPAKNTEGVGNHNIEVINTFDLGFHASSPLFTISEPEVITDREYKSGEFDRTEELAPVLKNVVENSTVRFRLDYNSEHAGEIESHVMLGQQELTPDEEGFYAVEITNASREVEIFAVPTDGATLNAEEIASLNPEQTEGITSISLTGEISPEDLETALSCFPSVENIDLSEMQGDLPDPAFAGMTSLTVVALPEVDAIGDNMFNGCTSLQAVDIPASVTKIGDGAFQGCTSLESIRLTGISDLGAEIFKGCENLTTITILDDHEANRAEAPQRKARKTAISDNTFVGVNPNCFVVLDEGVNFSAKGVNVIHTSSTTINEEQPDGSIIEREGRVYSANSDIDIVPGHALAIPHAFTLTDNAAISYKTDCEKWNGLVVPFDAEKITDPSGSEVEFFFPVDGYIKDDRHYLYSLEEGALTFTNTSEVKANIPYIFHSPEKGEYTFSATSATVPSTPTEIRVSGDGFDVQAVYKAKEMVASEAYKLNNDATEFVPAGEDEETATVEPFAIYATTSLPMDVIETGVHEYEISTSVDEIGENVETMTVKTDGDLLVIYTPVDTVETLYDTEGRAVRTLRLQAGRNVIETGLKGIYFIRDIKIML